MKCNFKIGKLFLCLVILIFSSLSSFIGNGQNQSDLIVEHFSRSDGLSHRNINDLIRGPSGRLWVSTELGINYFDGTEFKNLDFLFPNFRIEDLFRCYFSVDSQGNIWAVPAFRDPRKPLLIEKSNGYLPDEIIFSEFNLPVFEGIHHFEYITFEKSIQGRKTFDLLLDKLSISEEEMEGKHLWELIDILFDEIRSRSGNRFRIVSQMQDLSYVVWVSNLGFLWIENDFSDFKLIPLAGNGPSEEDYPRFLPIDDTNNLYIPIGIESHNLILKSLKLPKTESGGKYNIVSNRDGQLIVLLNGNQIIRVDRTNQELEELDFNQEQITVLLSENEKLFWVGTRNGLFRIMLKDDLFKNIGSQFFPMNSPAPIGLSISDIYQIEGVVYFNRYFEDLYRVGINSSSPYLIVPANLETAPKIITILPLSRGNLALGTTRGLFIYQTSNDSFFKVPGSQTPINQLLYDSDSNRVLLVVENGHYQYFDPENLTLSNREKLPAGSGSVLKMEGDFLYMNGKSSLISFHLQSGRIDTLFELNSARDINGSDIRAMHLSDSIYWLGSFEGFYGISTESRKVLYHFNLENGLSGEIVYSIVPFENGFWLGTDNGLTYLEPNKGTVKSFFEWDGLSHNEFNSRATLVDEEGKIWMGGLNGINVFDPKTVSKVEFPSSRLFLEQIQIHDTKNKLTYTNNPGRDHLMQPLNLRPSENNIYLRMAHFAGIMGDRTLFRWYLKSIEEPWSNFSNDPNIAYRNLPPGDYEMRISATDFRGIPSANEVVVPFSISQYWYYTSWAVSLWILLSVSLLALAMRIYYNRKIEKQNVLQLQELDRHKTNFYTNITHEFRTPLTVILGQTDRGSKLSRDYDEELKNVFKTVTRNGNQLLNLVNQMMDLARAEAGGIRLAEENVQLKDFLKHLVFSYESMAAEKNLDLITQFDDALDGDFRIDVRKFSRVIGNLISNAIKFSPPVSEIRIQAQLTDFSGKAENALVLKVIDKGPGIPTGEREKVFDRFYRINSMLTNTTPGTGIGLALSKELVDFLGGEIGVEPNDKGGSVFFIRMPLKPADPNARRTENKGKYALVEGSHSAGYPREENPDTAINEDAPCILLVEDNKDVLDYIRYCIPDRYQTIVAENGKKGLEIAISEVPDLIISDVMMPEMDGYSLCGAVKKHRVTDHIPVILLTARSDKESKLQGLKKGADAYLPKPFHREELLMIIDNMFYLSQKIRSKFGKPFSGETSNWEEEGQLEGEDLFINELNRTIRENFKDDEFSIEEMASTLFLSRSQLYRKVKALTGISPSVMLKKHRMNTARQIIENNPSLTSNELATRVGYASSKHFSNVFFDEFGYRPREVKNQA